MKVMRNSGICLCCGSMLTMSIVIALSNVIQYVDKLRGDSYISAFRYISIFQWVLIAVPFIVGCGMILSHKEEK